MTLLILKSVTLGNLQESSNQLLVISREIRIQLYIAHKIFFRNVNGRLQHGYLRQCVDPQKRNRVLLSGGYLIMILNEGCTVWSDVHYSAYPISAHQSWCQLLIVAVSRNNEDALFD